MIKILFQGTFRPLINIRKNQIFFLNHPINFCATKIFTNTRIAPSVIKAPATSAESSIHKIHLQTIKVFIGRQIKLVMQAGI